MDYYVEKFNSFEPNYVVADYLTLLKIERSDHWSNAFNFLDFFSVFQARTQLILLLLDKDLVGTMVINSTGTILAPQIYSQKDVKIERQEKNKLKLYISASLQGYYKAIRTQKSKKKVTIESFIQNFT